MEVRSSRCLRTLVTQMAHRGLSANEAAGELISMMARSKCSNQRPDTSMDSPACARGNFVLAARLPAVIYPVSIDPDGFRETAPNH